MNLKNLDQAVMKIAEKKNQLFNSNLNNADRVALEEELSKLELEFHHYFGAYIEEALFNVHDEYCPDNIVFKPHEYLASHYIKTDGGSQYDVDRDAGIPVEADDFPGIRARLVLVPGPTRLVLQGQEEPFKEIVWIAGN